MTVESLIFGFSNPIGATLEEVSAFDTIGGDGLILAALRAYPIPKAKPTPAISRRPSKVFRKSLIIYKSPPGW